ncbi:MAG: hypothetical protein CK604_06805 [Curvibacter sp. PD_MW3]|nr:MAG: hypothetical protein CK604_06805 [Curvibacter sp. PD_MW3]
MRILLLALMIALLPLRGWVGDAMAVEMVASALNDTEIATDFAAPHADNTRPEAEYHAQATAMAHADCPGHTAMMTSSDSPADDMQHPVHAADCATCAACQICHTVALTPVAWHIGTYALPAVQPQASSHHFASAERAPGFKPPIF